MMKECKLNCEEAISDFIMDPFKPETILLSSAEWPVFTYSDPELHLPTSQND